MHSVFGILCGLLWAQLSQSSSFRIKNVMCESFDTSSADFTRCEMKIVRRGVAAFYMACKLHQLPITSVELNFSLYKRSNGYRPYLFNQTLDYCFYMRNPLAHPLIYMMHKTIFHASNMNHTCPYNHDLVVDGMMYEKNDLKDLPVPNGEYMLNVKIAFYKKYRILFKIFIERSD